MSTWRGDAAMERLSGDEDRAKMYERIAETAEKSRKDGKGGKHRA